MKVFVAKRSTYRINGNEDDYLIIAKTKKDALSVYDWLDMMYAKKDLEELKYYELNIIAVEIVPRNEKRGMQECFDFTLHVNLEEGRNYKETIVADTEATNKALIKLFKEKNKEFLQKHFGKV